MTVDLYPIPGVRLAATSAGIKQGRQLDAVLIEIDSGAQVVGVFTRNAFCAAPVQVAKTHLAQQLPRYFLINAGYANAGMGQQGIDDANACCQALAKLMDCKAQAILPFSTGVIGERLPVDKIIAHLPKAVAHLREDGWAMAAQGIMTTDTRPKGISQRIVWRGQTLTITGIAKGSGMIKPNMATMLAYLATDAPVSQPVLQQILGQAVQQSFNRMTVDGDTSTNDACMLVATGKAGVESVDSVEHPLYKILLEAIISVCRSLAQQIVRDGEGATKFVTITVVNGHSEQACLQVASTVAESPLVKTALFASDPNWGRILAAIGRSGIDDLLIDQVSITINDVLVAEGGCRANSYCEEQGIAAMAEDEVVIVIDLHHGTQQASVWTCDLSEEYVRINAEYRT